MLKISSRQVKENYHVACSCVVQDKWYFYSFLYFSACHAFNEVFVLNVIPAYDLLIRVFDLNVIPGLTRNLSSLKDEILNQKRDPRSGPGRVCPEKAEIFSGK